MPHLIVDSPVERLADYIEKIQLSPAPLADAYRYASLPICVVDAVFSIGVRYSTTEAVVRHFCTCTGWARLATSREARSVGEHNLEELIWLCKGKDSELLAAELFGNRQRTSSRSGILKAEAVLLFAQALVSAGIDSFSDIQPDRLTLAEATILGLPGQGSGIAFDYFRMLAGDDDFIKPDRMVQRFVAKALDLPIEPQPRQAAILVKLAAKALKSRGHNWSPLRLDYAIWQHQRGGRDGDPIPPGLIMT